MDVCLHYKKDQDNLNDAVFMTQRALEDFPCRALPAFTPWFPSTADRSLPIKPKHAPPVISSKLLKSSRCQQRSEFELCRSQCPGDEDVCKRTLLKSPEAVGGKGTAQVENVSEKFKRSWSVFSHKMKTHESAQTFSRQFHKTIETYRLHFHQRAKWIIGELNCAPQSVEEVWTKLNHAIKHSRLPTCNANFQRNLSQIWVYCDILYCEFIGNFLRQKLQLSGEITLAVHKLGNIFKL
ncbi:shieldin complex subunit 3 [Pygocentrus nattereri]|uniref:shieldin complex subunit 3 n=1 Tax=Pygocentrus nattereri TaxID=42514 RepID=UPI001891BAC8|nr:shieldin complex subunit 3 [Pygocentrus nattereri]XP_017577330.2 shieldin complex subunit 3 [Pygocentrus nattereri]